MECVAILLDEKTDYDHIKKNVLGDSNLLYRLKNLKSENVLPKNRQKIKERLA